jgi:hypothetical protein
MSSRLAYVARKLGDLEANLKDEKKDYARTRDRRTLEIIIEIEKQ